MITDPPGHDLVGVYMHNWDDLDETGTCSSQTDYQCVQELCGEMGIPCHRADFVKEYWNHVFRYTFTCNLK